MKTVEEAKAALFSNIQNFYFKEIDIRKASSCVVAEDIISGIELPSFNQSAVDGYAIAIHSTDDKSFELHDEIKAGDNSSIKLTPGHATRIFTGAAVPEGAYAVVMQEYVEEKDNHITVSRDFKENGNIRPRASLIKKGDVVINKGTVLNPGSIGFLASLGYTKVKIFKNPSVSILVTGNEIIAPGTPIEHGQVYEANSFSLSTALKEMNVEVNKILHAPDEKEILQAKIRECITSSDIILITGGISVGKYDLVYDLLMEEGVETIVYKIAQKPGKPLFIGKLNNKLIFALPGNPSSVLVCFYEYVYPALRMKMGFEEPTLKNLHLKLTADIIKNAERAEFIRAKIDGDTVTTLDKQDSSTLASFISASALIYLSQESKGKSKGELVEVHVLPFKN